MSIFLVLGGASGIVVLFTAIVVLGRGIFRQVTATEENTMAVKELTGEVGEIKKMYTDLHTRVSVLEDRIKR